MIAYVLFVLAATPIFGAPASETVPVEHTSKEHEAQQSNPLAYQGKPETLSVQYPFGQVGYPNVPYYVRKTESGAVEVPLTPDAIVIPYTNYPDYHNYQYYYQNVGSRHQVPTPYTPSHYNQYPYVPENFLVVPYPNIQKVTRPNYVPEYDNAPRLLYYLPKSYYPTGYQTPIHQAQEQTQFQTQQTQQTSVEKSVSGVVTHGEGVVPHGQTVYETSKPVEGTQQQ